jgi:DNA-binding transcriptional LysR family regulator
MELRQLRYFLEIADQGTFSRAAEALSITQPALTAQIQKLASEIGGQLFHRTPRGIALTDVGEVVREQGRRAVDAADATLRIG